ncbi:MAG: phosphoenolpyruvate-protein phosphotransferase [Planctomycetes bacterium DG_23]|nr:MAG: phosphoenolpyruvate-protein phosphotransferase [Planctomycetes bacterium DG_23]
MKKGIAASPGVVIKEAFVLDSEEFRIPRRYIKGEEVEAELERLHTALAKAQEQIRSLQGLAAKRIGLEHALIFQVHLEMLQDKNLIEEITSLIRDKKHTPEYAISRALRKYIKAFQEMDDAYLAERVSDIFDVERRLLRTLLGEKVEELNRLQEQVVVIARNLSPSQTLALDKSKVLGFATDVGGRTGHTAIIARALDIPAVVGLGDITTDVSGGDLVIIDGTHGVVIISPDEETLENYRGRQQSFQSFEERLAAIRDLPAETLDGHRVTILGNIESPDEIPSCLHHGASGIGLYRTEFLYFGKTAEPTEDQHFQAYLRAVTTLGGRPIVIRTLDLGADKFGAIPERNPFLGLRSIRYCFKRLDLFRIQLRAILRASAFGPVRILFPMVATLDELRRAKRVVRDVMQELETEQIAFNKDVEIGIMIEVPAAVLIADSLAKECDFFSIGTNDLIQYTIAVDRANEGVAPLFNPAHPAILRLLKMTIDSGERNNIPVAMCGEMSGEMVYAMFLLGLGLKEFSVAPSTIPELKQVIRSVTMEEAAKVTNEVFKMDDPQEITRYLEETTKRVLPEAF